MEEKNKNGDKIFEDEQMENVDDIPLVALSEIYTSRESINLFVINKSKTKIKNTVDGNVCRVFIFIS